MSQTVVRAESIGKRYRIGARGAAPGTLKDALTATLLRRAGRLGAHPRAAGRRAAPGAEDFWALRDVTFEVERGQVLGVIGRNGSGKSTLLKVLARITPPTTGEATIAGQVGSLLEIGTGFHSELSGRENIFLSGTILGMRSSEIAARFDEIVEFSGVERFIDTPVKHYSSGMFLRLGFSVAAHLRTEILLVDEVLAVGDAAFQKKCIDKMSALASGGRTVLFVSHNLGAVARLCDRGMVLDSGRIACLGPAAEAIRAYGALLKERLETAMPAGERGVSVTAFALVDGGETLGPSSPLTLAFTLVVGEVYWGIYVYAGITSPEGTNLVIEVASSERFRELSEPGRYRVEMSLPALWLRPQGYSAWVKVIAHPKAGPTERYFSDWLEFVVTGDGLSDTNADRLLAPRARWKVDAVAEPVPAPIAESRRG